MGVGAGTVMILRYPKPLLWQVRENDVTTFLSCSLLGNKVHEASLSRRTSRSELPLAEAQKLYPLTEPHVADI